MVYFKEYNAPPLNKKEILRYMGCREVSPQIGQAVEECIDELCARLNYRVCFSEFSVKVQNGTADLQFMKTESKSFVNYLKGCEKAMLFAATIGLETDRAIVKYSSLSPLKSSIFQAIGAERIESLCDVFEKDLCKKMSLQKMYIKPRFSPGYGDFPLEAQKDIFRVLDCCRKIGLTLNESLIMSPSKSVTAIIGITASPEEKKIKKCARCNMAGCAYRR